MNAAQQQAVARVRRIGFLGPDNEAEKIALRLRIGRAVDVAHSRACRFRTLDAGQISHIASQFAARWAFKRSASREELETVIRALTWLHLAAGAIESLEAGDA
jgi:hypothetical protein